MPQELLWIDGQVMPLQQGRVSVEDRGFQFADGIYEVVRFYDGRPFLLDEHLERFERSAAGILLDPPGTREQRAARIVELFERGGFHDGIVYGQLTRGAANRRHVFPSSDCPPTELWYTRPLIPPTPETYESGVSLLTLPDDRWAHCQFKTIALLPNILAKERARRAGCFEAVFVSPDGIVAECAASNIYAVRDGQVWTTPLNGRVLPGVTRIAVLDVAREAGIVVREETFSHDELLAAEEAFISSTTIEILAATRIDDRVLGTGTPGKVTHRLANALRDSIRTICTPLETVS